MSPYDTFFFHPAMLFISFAYWMEILLMLMVRHFFVEMHAAQFKTYKNIHSHSTFVCVEHFLVRWQLYTNEEFPCQMHTQEQFVIPHNQLQFVQYPFFGI